MKKQPVTLEEILLLSVEMVEHGECGDWPQLLRKDQQRDDMLRGLKVTGQLNDAEQQQVDQIRQLQQRVIELSTNERNRIREEYLTHKGRLSVSNCYLENTANTLTR